MNIERNPFRPSGDSDEDMSDLPMKASDSSNQTSSQSRGYQAGAPDEHQMNAAGYFPNPSSKSSEMKTNVENKINLPPMPVAQYPRSPFSLSGNVQIGASEQVEGVKGLELSLRERQVYQAGYRDGYTRGHREGVDSAIHGGTSDRLGGIGFTAGENMGPPRGLISRHERRNAVSIPSGGGGFGVAGAVSLALPDQYAQEMNEIKEKGRKYD